MRDRIRHFKSAIASLKRQLRSTPARPEPAHDDRLEEQNRQIQALTVRWKEQVDLVGKLRAENEFLTATIARENLATDEETLMQKYKDLLAVNCARVESEAKLQGIIDVTRAELRAMRDENRRLRAKVNEFDGLEEATLKNRIEKAALSSQLADARNHNAELLGDVQSAQHRSETVDRHRLQLEARLVKMKDQTAILTTKFGAVNDEQIDVQRFGFLLADALDEQFNARLCEQELRRLIIIAKDLRVAFVESPTQLRRQDFGSHFAAEFDSLHQQIAGLKSRPQGE